MIRGSFYEAALETLNEAHKACLKHPDRPVLGMSHGPFSGVNKALGIVGTLEEIVQNQASRIRYMREENLRAKRKGLRAAVKFWKFIK